MSAQPTGLILAAGRGSRLGSITVDRPKCMVELGGAPLIDWQTSALRQAGLSSVVVATGYRHEMIEALGFDTVHNPDWAATNMVGTLLCVLEMLPGPFVVSYSDIVYSPDHVTPLLACDADLVISYDTDWLELWRRRFDDPLSDAETFLVDGQNRVTEIGGRAASVQDIHGQFIGLMKISEIAARWIRELIDESPELRSTSDTTKLLSTLISGGRVVYGAQISGGWCEIDGPTDLRVGEQLLSEGKLRFPRPRGLQ